MPTPDEKRAARQAAHQRLKTLDSASRLSAELAICEQLGAIREQNQTIAAFWPLPSEPDIRPALHRFQADGAQICLPVSLGEGSMSFHRTDDFNALVRSKMGVLEPDPQHCPMQDLHEIDLVLVPGLAFTESGQRLGRGGGYYDRFLATLPRHVRTLGIALPCQIFDTLPTEPHDIPVQRVLLPPKS